MQDEKLKNEEVLEINVGGSSEIQVRKSLLCKIPGTKLESMFTSKSGKVYLDRNPETFTMMINFLKNDTSLIP